MALIDIVGLSLIVVQNSESAKATDRGIRLYDHALRGIGGSSRYGKCGESRTVHKQIDRARGTKGCAPIGGFTADGGSISDSE